MPIAAQSRPPLDGAGLLQLRYLCISPPPHVTSQVDQSLQSEYAPSSTNQKASRKMDENGTLVKASRKALMYIKCMNI